MIFGIFIIPQKPHKIKGFGLFYALQFKKNAFIFTLCHKVYFFLSLLADILIIPASTIQTAHEKESEFLLSNEAIEIVRCPIFCTKAENRLRPKANL